MPSRKVHQQFDLLLRLNRIVKDLKGANSVHGRLDRGVIRYGSDHQILDHYHTEEGIRDWLEGFPDTTPQDMLTDYLRIGLGHIELDEMRYLQPDLSDDVLVEVALRSFRRKGLHRTTYRPRGEVWSSTS